MLSDAIRDDYAQLLLSEGANPGFLAASFSEWDSRFIEDAKFLKNLAMDHGTIESLFTLVHNNIASNQGSAPMCVWPRGIWERGYGSCDQQSWLLADLTYQLGYESQVVYLMHPGTEESPHTICEIRSNDKVWFADPFSKVLLQKSIDEVSESKKLLKEIWPDKPIWREAITNCVFFTPSCPADYCLRNQVGSRNGIRFGDPPVERLERYRTMSNTRFELRYWFFPWRVVVAKEAENNAS